MAKSIAIKCPSCGASSFEDAHGGDRSCLYCRTTFRVPVDAPPVILKRTPYPVPPRHAPPKANTKARVLQLIWTAFVVLLMLIFMAQFFSKKSDVDKAFERHHAPSPPTPPPWGGPSGR